jgi:hypothetical protein
MGSLESVPGLNQMPRGLHYLRLVKPNQASREIIGLGRLPATDPRIVHADCS